VSGWAAAHAYSRDVMQSSLAWGELLADAVHHAREGMAVSAGQRRVTAATADLFSAAADADIRRSLWPIYHPARLAAERFVQSDLATTLERVARDGAEEFYRGATARRIAEAAAVTGSPLTAADLAEHRADWVEPLRLRYREGEAVSLPPPTQGFAALMILALLEERDGLAHDFPGAFIGVFPVVMLRVE
jgi:gamma-glutamyltranspeptidase/glutathione hydrolase